MMHACRYAAPLYIDLKKTVVTHLPNGEDEEEEEEYPKIFIGEARAHACPHCVACLHASGMHCPLAVSLLAIFSPRGSVTVPVCCT